MTTRSKKKKQQFHPTDSGQSSDQGYRTTSESGESSGERGDRVCRKKHEKRLKPGWKKVDLGHHPPEKDWRRSLVMTSMHFE